MQKILISACLIGENVRYDGGNSAVSNEMLDHWDTEERLVPICPEMAGGLSAPRPSAEIGGADTEGVFLETNAVHTRQGDDVTSFFLAGADKTLALARSHGIRLAILKDGSPSCGSSQISDGSFSGCKTQGQGVTTCLLRRHGIHVFSENQIDAAAELLAQPEQADGE